MFVLNGRRLGAAVERPWIITILVPLGAKGQERLNGEHQAIADAATLKFLAYLREELTIVLATASSDAVLPQIMKKLELMGVKDSVVGLVIPTGYSFNLDAFSI